VDRQRSAEAKLSRLEQVVLPDRAERGGGQRPSASLLA
jgi:hypothetical protein